MARKRNHPPERGPLAMAEQVQRVARSLAVNDIRTLEREHGYQHGRFVRGLFHASALDPRCCSAAMVPIAVSITLSLLITALWQISAVYLAGRFELGITNTTGLLLSGAVVAMLVVSLDWDIIHKRIRRETRIPMLIVRFLFVLIMAVLVSEAIAGWVFDRDIAQQVTQENDTRRVQRAERIAGDEPRLRELDAQLAALTKAVTDATTSMSDAQFEMQPRTWPQPSTP
jgi:hypothetical protein